MKWLLSPLVFVGISLVFTSHAFSQQVGSTGLTARQIDHYRTASVASIESDEDRDKLVAEIEKEFSSEQPEAIRMLLAILKGSSMKSNEGWFGPAEKKHDWSWLTALHELEPDKPIHEENFKGKAEWFHRLDRNQDGKLEASDLDWTENNSWVSQAAVVNRIFRMIDREGDNRVTVKELESFFDRVRDEKDSFSSEDLRNQVLGGGNSFQAGDAPTPKKLVEGLFKGEIGSIYQGPNVGEKAPNFSLKTHDGSETITLHDCIGKKPVVLVFGNFTCGPFRRNFPEVNDLQERYQSDATFLGVYVREAHPEDGWSMQSNSKVGVLLSQPKNYEERVVVAKKCQKNLNFHMPLLVDDIDDSTGHAYSGMPARLYVIDLNGNVTYKSGRGPYGFKPGELEQALLMTLVSYKL